MKDFYKMKNILILHSNMQIGGAETSLLGLLQSIDYSKYNIDLMLLHPSGELMPLIPKNIHLISPPKAYKSLALPIKQSLLKEREYGIVAARLIGKLLGRLYADKTYATKQLSHKLSLWFLPKIKSSYDMAISFIDPHYIVTRKVDAKVTLGWLHTDFSKIQPSKRDYNMWGQLDYIVHVSSACKKEFLKAYPHLEHKSIVIENILSALFIQKQSVENKITFNLSKDSITLLSIGRFSTAKNFDNVPEICRLLRADGLDVTWYLIGYGGDEGLILQKIQEHGMEPYVKLLGKKENPYPYIQACDVYVQPSRYEGKCVAVREAQMLGKPVIITNYPTSGSQLEDGVDGLIVPLDNEGCAAGIAAALRNPPLLARLAETCRKRDYSNAQEIQKLYDLIE